LGETHLDSAADKATLPTSTLTDTTETTSEKPKKKKGSFFNCF